MIYLINIINWIKNLKLTKTDILYIGLIIFILIFIQQCNLNSKLKKEIESTKTISDRNLNNYKASLDTIKFIRNREGLLIAEKLAYVYDINLLTSENKTQLEKYINALQLNKKLKGVNSVLSVELKIKNQIVNSKSEVNQLSDSLYSLSFSDSINWDKYNWRRFNSTIDIQTNNKQVSIIKSNFNWQQGIELKTAIITENGINSLRVTSSHPDVEFTNIENINLINDKLNQKQTKKAGWSIGVGGGFGTNLSSNQNVTISPYIGVGIYWSPKWLRF